LFLVLGVVRLPPVAVEELNTWYLMELIQSLSGIKLIQGTEKRSCL